MTENASYKLPPNWTWTQLGNVANIVGGGTPRRDRPEYYAGGNIPWATPTDIDPDEIKFITDTSEKITEKGLKESSARLLPKGTILFSSRASIGKIAISGEKMATNQGFANVIPFDGIDSKFIAYGMRNFVRNIESLGSGTTFLEVAKSSLKEFDFPLAPTTEQKRIVSKIEELFKESKSAREALNNVSQILKKFRYSVLRSAYEVAQDSKWKLMKLRDIIENLQSGFACGKRDENGYIQLRMNNIGLEGKLVTDSLLRVPKSETNIKKYRLKKHDIIFNNTNSPELVGKTIIFNDEIEDCVYSNHLTRIRVNEQLVLPEYLMHFLRLEQKKGTFELLCRRFVGQAAVPRESLLNLDFRLPSIEEQSKVISKLNELFSFADQIEKSVEEAKKRADIIDQAILSKAFRGELVPQDPKDEPASVLLDRIRQEKELEIKQTKVKQKRRK